MPPAIAIRRTAAPQVRQAQTQTWLLHYGGIALLVLACAYLLTFNFSDPDLWGHVRYGQDWLAAGEMPRTATHTYTAIDHPWVNHENVAELFFAIGYEHIGIYGLLVAKCLLGMSILATMAWTASRHGVHAISAWTLLLLVAANMEAFFLVRPQLFSFAFCTLALVCLDRGFPEWPERRTIRFAWLSPLPAIFIAWVNSHGGFMAGLCIVGTLLAGRMIELLLFDGRRSLGRVISLALIGLACIVTTVVNPYGLGMHQWLWQAWGGAPPEILEWAPPTSDHPVFWRFAALIIVAMICLTATLQRRDWPQIVVLACVAWQASLHLRHIAFVALLVGFWLPKHWESLRLRFQGDRKTSQATRVSSPWLRAATAAAILFAIVTEGVLVARRLSDLPVMRSEYPVDAIQFMAKNDLSGKAVVAFNWAQYALAALAPSLKVGFDGRFDTCYPQEAIDVHFDFTLGDFCSRDRRPDAGPIDGRRALEYGHPDLVLFDRANTRCADIMQQEAARDNPEWTLLYSDSFAELWGRRSRYDDPASPFYLPPDRRRHNVVLPDAKFQWPALPERNYLEESSQQMTES